MTYRCRSDSWSADLLIEAEDAADAARVAASVQFDRWAWESTADSYPMTITVQAALAPTETFVVDIEHRPKFVVVSGGGQR